LDDQPHPPYDPPAVTPPLPPQPDVCRDFKETGYCGWGDACKYLHDRGDHAEGWQVDRDEDAKRRAREERVARRMARGADPDGPSSDAEDAKRKGGGLPFACHACRTAWGAANAAPPVSLRCGHHLCETCALRDARDKCPHEGCGADTGGVFNAARDIRKRMKADPTWARGER